ncbi:MAG: CoA ester lyase [Candidatus Izimaplasma sp.]|nr:CoA ester lyase [Candidatus Izimaplasma bacterium]
MFRSLLFVPGNNPSMLQNADIFMCDAIIFDLEDSVNLDEKDNARNLVETYLLTTKELPKAVILRINPVNSELINDDLKLLETRRIDYVLLPKANKISLFVLDKILNDLENKFELKQTKVICLVEEAKAIIEVYDLAIHERVRGLLLGAEDLTSELEINRTISGEEILYARSKVIYAAISNKIIPIDTPFTDINDTEGLIKDCKKALNLGMKAKTAIHPSQLETINDIFSPSKEAIEWAKALLAKAKTLNKGAFQFEGKMIDRPIIEKAKKIIEKAKLFDLM